MGIPARGDGNIVGGADEMPEMLQGAQADDLYRPHFDRLTNTSTACLHRAPGHLFHFNTSCIVLGIFEIRGGGGEAHARRF